MIEIYSEVFLIWAFLFLILPLDWILAAVIAAFIHEMSHISAVYVFKGRILKLKIVPGGCVLETDTLWIWQEFLSIFLGPLGSLMLLAFSRTIPQIAVCGLLHGLYNLMPVLPLDGGRLLQLLFYRFCPLYADWLMQWIAISVSIFFSVFAICYQIYNPNIRLLPLFIALLWDIKFMPRKIPCKPSKTGLQ